MTPPPSVSVITPFYNSCRFLAEAVESVLTQTFTDWELLLVDDGSTDSSPEVARAYVAQHPDRIFYLRHLDGKNHGLPATRNLALRSCRGEFVALLDSDDIWRPRKLAQQVELINRYPEAGMVFGRSEYWYNWAGAPADCILNSIPNLAPGGRLYYPPELMKISYPLGRLGSPCPSDMFFRRSALDNLGGFEEAFDIRFWVCEDIALLAKVFLNVPVFVSDECWDRYRRHSESGWAIAQATGGEEDAKTFYFEWLREYLDGMGIADEELWRLYRLRSWRYRHRRLAGWLKRARRLARSVKRSFS